MNSSWPRLNYSMSLHAIFTHFSNFNIQKQYIDYTAPPSPVNTIGSTPPCTVILENHLYYLGSMKYPIIAISEALP
jgi:hypothetical protein